MPCSDQQASQVPRGCLCGQFHSSGTPTADQCSPAVKEGGHALMVTHEWNRKRKCCVLSDGELWHKVKEELENQCVTVILSLIKFY